MRSRAPLPALTGLRFVAALQVLLYHALPRDLGPGWLRAVVGNGYVGVSLFFVLSGFILAYNYEDAFRERRVRWRDFWWARAARVYPVYLLGLLIAIPPFFLHGRPPAEVARRIAASVGSGVLLVQAWSPRTACVVNCPGWSVSAEALFYLVYPLAALLLLRVPRERLPVLAAAAWAASLVPPLAYLWLRPDGAAVPGPLSGAEWLLRLKYHPVARLGEFVLGMAAGALFLRRMPGAPRRWIGPAALGAILCVLLLGPRIPYPLLHNGLLAPAFAVLIYRLGRGHGRMARALSGPRMGVLGGASYALYVLHIPLGIWLAWTYRWLGIEPSPAAGFVTLLSVALAAALLVFRHVEEPARRALRDLPGRLAARRGVALAPAAGD